MLDKLPYFVYNGVRSLDEQLIIQKNWAGKPHLGNAAWGAPFPSERALPAGGFGSVHTPSP